MEELIKTLINETRKTNELLMYGYKGKDPNELLTAEQISEETGIPINNVRELFRNNKKLAVQTYTKPHRITRKAWNEFISERR